MSDSDEVTSVASETVEDFAAAATGDPAAFARLVDPFVASIASQVRRVGRGLLRADADAEDLVQRVLAIAWRQLPSCEFNGARAFRGWLLQLTRNVVRDRVKYLRAKGRSRVGHSAKQVEDVVAEMTSVPGRVVRKERQRQLRDALAELPDAQRSVVEQHLLGEKTLAQIAQALGISKNAVWERLQRGLLRLRDLLREGSL